MPLAQVSTAQELRTEDGPQSYLQAADYTAVTYLPPYPEDPKKRTSSFEIRFSDNFPAEARAAFEYAAAIWGRYLRSDVTIVVQAAWSALPEGTLGSAGPLLVGNFDTEAVLNVWYPTALANAIAGEDVLPNAPDIRAFFNSEFPSWYFGLDGSTPPRQYDFVTVVLHELGHGLGFTSSFAVDDGDASNGEECPDAPAGAGCWGYTATGATTPFPAVFDLFLENMQDQALLNETRFPNPSVALANMLQEGVLFFDGSFSFTANDDAPVNLYAPYSFDAGSSVAHLDEGIFMTPPGGEANPNALMTPFLARGEALHNPGPVTCAIFEDLGWEMGAGCLAEISDAVYVEEVPSRAEGYTLTAFYPNPAVQDARAVLQVQASQAVTVEVFNVAGQRVAVQARSYVAAQQAYPIRLEAAQWAPGTYFVRIWGETFITTRPLIHLGR